MKSQTNVSPVKIMDRIRVLGDKVLVVEGPDFDKSLAYQLDMPEFTPEELAQAIWQLVAEGKLHASSMQMSLGRAGIGNDEVFVDAIKFSVA